MVRRAVDSARAHRRGQARRLRRLPAGPRRSPDGARVRRAARRRAVRAPPVVADALRRPASTSARRPRRPARSRSPGRPIRSQRALTGAFVKVLVRYRPDDEEAIRDGQWEKLDALQTWCRGAGKPLVVEILVARRGESEDEFEAVGRPGDARRLHRRGLSPRADARVLEDRGHAVARRRAHDRPRDCRRTPRCRQIILGKAAELATIGRWFAAAADSPTASGFAIGRSVFWEPSAAFLSGASTADQRGRRHRRQLPPTRGRLAAKAAYSRRLWGTCSATSATRSGRSRGSPPLLPSRS